MKNKNNKLEDIKESDKNRLKRKKATAFGFILFACLGVICFFIPVWLTLK